MKAKIAEKEIDNILQNTIATLSFEGMIIPEERKFKKVIKRRNNGKKYDKRVLKAYGVTK